MKLSRANEMGSSPPREPTKTDSAKPYPKRDIYSSPIMSPAIAPRKTAIKNAIMSIDRLKLYASSLFDMTGHIARDDIIDITRRTIGMSDKLGRLNRVMKNIDMLTAKSKTVRKICLQNFL